MPFSSSVCSKLSKCPPYVSVSKKKNIKLYPWRFTIAHKMRFAMTFGLAGPMRNVLILSQQACTENGILTSWVDYTHIPLANLHYLWASSSMQIGLDSAFRRLETRLRTYLDLSKDAITLRPIFANSMKVDGEVITSCVLEKVDGDAFECKSNKAKLRGSQKVAFRKIK